MSRPSGRSKGGSETIGVETRERSDFVDLQGRLEGELRRLGWSDGILTLYVPHTTAGITIQENADPDVMRDFALCLDRMVPWEDPEYRHFEGNTAAHVKASLVGSSVQIPIEEGRLLLGRWQAPHFCEFDGPRSRILRISFHPY